MGKLTNRSIATLPFAGDVSFAKFLKKTGINVLSISNNHILEHGEKGFDDTVHTLRSEELSFIGSTYNGDKPYRMFRIKGKKIAMASFNQIHDFPNPGIYSNLNTEGLHAVLEEIKKNSPELIYLRTPHLLFQTKFYNIPTILELHDIDSWLFKFYLLMAILCYFTMYNIEFL